MTTCQECCVKRGLNPINVHLKPTSNRRDCIETKLKRKNVMQGDMNTELFIYKIFKESIEPHLQGTQRRPWTQIDQRQITRTRVQQPNPDVDQLKTYMFAVCLT